MLIEQIFELRGPKIFELLNKPEILDRLKNPQFHMLV